MAPIIHIEGEPSHTEQAYWISGIIFCAVYGIFFSIAVWRLLTYIRETYNFDVRRVRRGCLSWSRNSDLIRDKKLAVHIALAAFALFEIAYGISFIAARTLDYRGYAFHIFAMIFLTFAFCLIPIIWNKLLEFGGAYYYVRNFSRVAVVTHTLVCILFLLVKLEAKNGNQTRVIAMAISQATIAAAIHLILSFWMLMYGLRMYYYLISAQTTMNLDLRKERKRAINRILLVAIGFSLCNLVRSICTTLVVSDNFDNFDVYEYISHIAWFLISQWIPFIIPGCLMLYVCAPSSVGKGRGSASKIRKEDEAMAKFHIAEPSGPAIFSEGTDRGLDTIFGSSDDCVNPVVEMSEGRGSFTCDAESYESSMTDI